MKRLTLTIPATRRLLASAALAAMLCGCQSIPAFHPPTDQGVSKAFSYYGKERPSGFLSSMHGAGEDSGHQLRGYRFGPRHWSF